MRFVELCAGVGGLSLGLKRAGLLCMAHAEIDAHAAAVLRYRWPDVPVLGDITQVDWTAYRGCDVVSGGTPCQDLSVAGKGAGLAGARSGLFFEQVRAWHETHAPYLLWENVDGALSSNKGKDFALILQTLVGSAVARPRDGWPSAGVVSGSSAVAAWRVFDLQHFGPPQRRHRVFILCARAGACDPAEILALGESMCRHSSPRDASRQDVTGTLSARTRGGGGLGTDFELAGGLQVQSVTGDVTHALTSVGADASEDGTCRGTPIVAQSANVPGPLAFHIKQDPISDHVSPCLGVKSDGMGLLEMPGPTLYDTTQITSAANRSNPQPGAVSHPMAATAHVPLLVGFDIAPTLSARDFKGPSSYQDGSIQATVFPDGRPRRLMPVECERLMGWPDEHTAYGVTPDGTRYTLKDSPRYRVCGNGVGLPVTEWIGRRLMWAEANTPK